MSVGQGQYGDKFDANKADQIFNFLLREKQIQLSPDHNIPSANELRNKKYCK
jgi:hypothetical protein